MVLNLNAHWISWISTILFMADHFVMKMNINDVLWQKNITYLATCQRSINVHQSERAPNAECEKPHHNKTKAPRLSKLDPQAYDILGTMFYKCITDRRKPSFFCFKWNYSVKSMQTFLYVCSVAFFQLFMRTFITFEYKICFTWNLVSLCQNISSTAPQSLKQKYLFLAELLRFR